jgi:hypothetical protein
VAGGKEFRLRAWINGSRIEVPERAGLDLLIDLMNVDAGVTADAVAVNSVAEPRSAWHAVVLSEMRAWS